STTGRTILRLIEPTSGEVSFQGKNVTTLDKRSLRALRKEMQIIFQDPYASLNPRMTVGSIIGEALVIHKLAKSRREREERVVQLLETTGLSADHLRRYPHEFSGGQRQRIGIARALAVSPKLIVADEPVSALDVSIQAQIINLLEEQQAKFGLTYRFIAHARPVRHCDAAARAGGPADPPCAALFCPVRRPEFGDVLREAIPERGNRNCGRRGAAGPARPSPLPPRCGARHDSERTSPAASSSS